MLAEKGSKAPTRICRASHTQLAWEEFHQEKNNGYVVVGLET